MDLHVSPILIPLPPPSAPHPSGSSQCTSPEHLSHTSNLDWRSVSPLIIYMFQCYSLRTSHPHLLPQSPKVCSKGSFFLLVLNSLCRTWGKSTRMHVCMHAQSLSCVQLFATPWTVATRLLCLWNSPGKKAGVGCYFLHQGIFQTQELNPHLLLWQADSLPMSHQGSPGWGAQTPSL